MLNASEYGGGVVLSTQEKPISLISECLTQKNGVGPAIELGDQCGKLLVLTLGVNRVSERDALGVSVWGSPDQVNWGPAPLARFAEKDYCGLYSILLNLTSRPDVRYLRVAWNMKCWGKHSRTPIFGFYVFAEESGNRMGRGSAERAFA